MNPTPSLYAIAAIFVISVGIIPTVAASNNTATPNVTEDEQANEAGVVSALLEIVDELSGIREQLALIAERMPVEAEMPAEETENVTIEVMKHVCDAAIQNVTDFDNVDGPDDGNTTEFHDKVLACPTVTLPGDNYTDGAVSFEQHEEFDFSIEAADGTPHTIENTTFRQQAVSEGAIGVDVNGDGDLNDSLDTSVYLYEGVASGNITVNETLAPNNTRPGALEFTPTALAENDDAATLLEPQNEVFANDTVIELDTSRDTLDDVITLHVYNFQDPDPAPNESESASITFSDQESDGANVSVDNVVLPDSGYIGIHDDSLVDANTSESILDSVIGASGYLSAGQHENVVIDLAEDSPEAGLNGTTLEANQSLIATAYQETSNDTVYDFITSGGTQDTPYVTGNGTDAEAVLDDAFITVTAMADVIDDDMNATANDTDNTTETTATTGIDQMRNDLEQMQQELQSN